MAAAPEAPRPETNQLSYKNAKARFGTSADGSVANGNMRLSYVERTWDNKNKKFIEYDEKGKENHARKLADTYNKLKATIYKDNADQAPKDLKSDDIQKNIPQRLEASIGSSFGGVFASVTGGNGELSGLLTTVMTEYITRDENKGKPVEEVLKAAYAEAEKFKSEFQNQERENNKDEIQKLEKLGENIGESDKRRLDNLKRGSRADVAVAIATLNGELKVLTTGDTAVIVQKKDGDPNVVRSTRQGTDVQVQTLSGVKPGERVVLCNKNKVDMVTAGMKANDTLDTLLQKVTTPGQGPKGQPERTSAASGGSDEEVKPETKQTQRTDKPKDVVDNILRQSDGKIAANISYEVDGKTVQKTRDQLIQEARKNLLDKVRGMVDPKDPQGSMFFEFAQKGLEYKQRMVKDPVRPSERKGNDEINTEKQMIEGPQATRQTLRDIAGPQREKKDEPRTEKPKDTQRTDKKDEDKPETKQTATGPQREAPKDKTNKPEDVKTAPHTGEDTKQTSTTESSHTVPPGLKAAPTAEGEKQTGGKPPTPEAAPAPGDREKEKGRPEDTPEPGAKPTDKEDKKEDPKIPTEEKPSEIEYVGAAFNEWGPATENLDLMKHLRSDSRKETRPKGFWGTLTFPARHPWKFLRQSWQDSIWKSAFDQQALRFASEVRAIAKSHAFNDQSLAMNVDASMLDKALEEGKKLRDMQPWWRKSVNWVRDRAVDVTGFAMNSQQKYATEWLRANGADLAKAQVNASLAEQNALGEKFAYNNNGRDGRLTAADVQFANSQQIISEKLGESRVLYEGERQGQFSEDIKAIIKRYHDGDIKGNDVALAKAMNEYMYKFVDSLSADERKKYGNVDGLELATNIISLAKKVDRNWDKYMEHGNAEGKTKFDEMQVGLLMGKSEFSQARGRRAENNIFLDPNHMLAARLAEKKMMMDGKGNRVAEGALSFLYNTGIPSYDFWKDAVAYGGAYAVGSAASVANFGKNKAIGALTLPMGPIGGALGVSAMAGLKESGVVISHNGKLYGVGGRVLSEMAQANKDVALGLTSDGEIRKKYESVFVDARSYSDMLNGVDALLSKNDLTADEAKRLMTFAAEVQARQRLTDASTEPGFGRVSLPQNFIKYEAGKDNQQAAILRQRAMDATIKLLADPKYTDMIGDPYTGKFADLTKFMEAQLSVGSDKERVANWLVNNAKVPRVNASTYAENLFNTYGSMNIDKQKSLEISMAAAAKMNAWEGVKKAGQTALMAPVLGAVYGTYFGEAFNLGHDILRQDFAHKGIAEGLSQGVGEYFQDWGKVLTGDIPLEVNSQGNLEADLSVLQKGALFGRNVWEQPFDIWGKHDQLINGINLRLDGGLRYVDDHHGHEALVDIRTGKVTLDMSNMNFTTMDTDGDGQAELVLTDARTGGLLDQQKIFADAQLPPPTLASVNVVHNQINLPGGTQAVDILSPHMGSHTAMIEGHATAIPDGTEWREMAGPPHGHFNLVVTGDPNRVLASDVHWDAQGHMQFDKAHSMMGNVNLQEAANTVHGTRIEYGTRVDTQHVDVFGPNGEVDKGEWSKHIDPVTGRQWYGNNTPGFSDKNELRAYNWKVDDDKVMWRMGDMTKSFQHGNSPGIVHVNHLVEAQAHGQLAQGEQVGFYFSMKDHINQGIFLPVNEKGELLLDPHSADPDVAKVSQMVLDQQALPGFDHASELTHHRDIFNVDFVEAVHRKPDGHGGFTLEVFATAKGDGTMPHTIDIPHIVEDPKIVETSQQVSTLTVNLTEPITRIVETSATTIDETADASIFELHSPPMTFDLPILPIPHRNPIEQYTYKTTQETANAVQDPTKTKTPPPVVSLPYDGEKKKQLEGQRTALEAKQKELKDKLEAEKDDAKKIAIQKELDEVNKQLAEADMKIYLGKDLDAMTNAEKQAALSESKNEQKHAQDKIKGQKDRLEKLKSEGKGGSDEAKNLSGEIKVWEEKLRRIDYRVQTLEKSLQAVKVEGPKPIEPKPEPNKESPHTIDVLIGRKTMLEYAVEEKARLKHEAEAKGEKANADAFQAQIDHDTAEINAIDAELASLMPKPDAKKDAEQKESYKAVKQSKIAEYREKLKEVQKDPQGVDRVKAELKLNIDTLPTTDTDIDALAHQIFYDRYANSIVNKEVTQEAMEKRVNGITRLLIDADDPVRRGVFNAEERAAVIKILGLLDKDIRSGLVEKRKNDLDELLFDRYRLETGSHEEKLKAAIDPILSLGHSPETRITEEEAKAYAMAYFKAREVANRSFKEGVFERIIRWEKEIRESGIADTTEGAVGGTIDVPKTTEPPMTEVVDTQLGPRTTGIIEAKNKYSIVVDGNKYKVSEEFNRWLQGSGLKESDMTIEDTLSKKPVLAKVDDNTVSISGVNVAMDELRKAVRGQNGDFNRWAVIEKIDPDVDAVRVVYLPVHDKAGKVVIVRVSNEVYGQLKNITLTEAERQEKLKEARLKAPGPSVKDGETEYAEQKISMNGKHFKVSLASDVGGVREIDEDYSFVEEMQIGKFNCSLVGVYDGMGGEAAGDAASKLGAEATKLALQEVKNAGKKFKYMDRDGVQVEINTDKLDTLAEVQKLFDYVSLTINRLALSKGLAQVKSGSTAAGILAVNGKTFAFHCGDARVYKNTSTSLQQLTKDHSLVQRLMDAGKVKLEEAKDFPAGNMVTRNIIEGSKFDVQEVQLGQGESLVIMCDGIPEAYDDEYTNNPVKMQNAINEAQKDENPALKFVKGARQAAGGAAKDNISAAVIMPLAA